MSKIYESVGEDATETQWHCVGIFYVHWHQWHLWGELSVQSQSGQPAATRLISAGLQYHSHHNSLYSGFEKLLHSSSSFHWEYIFFDLVILYEDCRLPIGGW